MSSDCKEMTQKLVVLELSVFQEVISPYPMWPLFQTRIWILFALDYTAEERKKICCPGGKQTAGMVFLSENQCEVLLPGLEKGEAVWEEMLFSSPISLKFPFFWFHSLQSSVLSRGPNINFAQSYGPPVITDISICSGKLQSSPDSSMHLLISPFKNQKS